MFPSLQIRSYQGESQHHSHAFAQVVLPVSGRMEIEVQGRAECLDPSLAAWVAPSAGHSQVAERSGRFLVLDCPADWLSEAALATLAQQVYLPISESAKRLIEFANLAGNASLGAHSAHLVPLLLGVLVDRTGHKPSGMEVLLARLEANPGAAWSNEAMARTAGLSLGQLHKRIAERFDQAPQALLAPCAQMVGGKRPAHRRNRAALGLFRPGRVHPGDEPAVRYHARRLPGRHAAAWVKKSAVAGNTFRPQPPHTAAISIKAGHACKTTHR